MLDALYATWTEVESVTGFRFKTWSYGPESLTALDVIEDGELSDLEEHEGADALHVYLRNRSRPVFTAKAANVFDVPIHVVRIAAAELVADGRVEATPDGLVAREDAS